MKSKSNLIVLPSYIIKRFKEGMTHIRINGDYDVVGFFPQEKNSNMVIVLKERGRNANGNY